MLVAIAEVVLAELCSRVALRLENLCKCRVLLLETELRSRDAYRCHACSDRQLACDEGRSTGCTARLAIVVGEEHALLGNSVDVGRLAHHAVAVSTDVPRPNVIAEDDQYV